MPLLGQPNTRSFLDPGLLDGWHGGERLRVLEGGHPGGGLRRAVRRLAGLVLPPPGARLVRLDEGRTFILPREPHSRSYGESL